MFCRTMGGAAMPLPFTGENVMTGYNIISRSLWRSEKFKKLPDANAKLLFMYFVNGPHSNSCGCYVVHLGYIMADFGWTEEQARKGIDSLCDTLLIGYNFEENTVHIPKFFDHNPPSNPKHAIKVFNDTLSIPYPEFRALVIQDLATLLEKKGWKLPEEKQHEMDTLLHTLSKGYPHLTQRNSTNLKKDTPNGVSKEIDPENDTLSKRGTRIENYLNQNFNSIKIPEPFFEFAQENNFKPEQIQFHWNQFFDFWKSKSGKDATKLDWLATWRRWIRKEIANAKTQTHGSSKSQRADDAVSESLSELEAEGLFGQG